MSEDDVCKVLINSAILYIAISGVAGGGGCMWVHLHPVHAPVHPSYIICICSFVVYLATCIACHSMHVSLHRFVVNTRPKL